MIVTTGVLPRAVPVQPTAVTDFQDGHGTVWTVENGRLARREVTFGPELLDGRLPILDGVPPNASVVAASVTGLRVGRTAHVTEARPR